MDEKLRKRSVVAIAITVLTTLLDKGFGDWRVWLAVHLWLLGVVWFAGNVVWLAGFVILCAPWIVILVRRCFRGLISDWSMIIDNRECARRRRKYRGI
jgi:hypothetical protein